jgi:acetaldehyde dehydrogenase/alcohol dehydrogenase
MICASEQSVIILDSVYDEVRALFRRMGCHLLNDAELEKTRKTILINGALNAKIV